MKQIHSCKVIQINNTLNSKNKVAEGLITKAKNQIPLIYKADYIAILLADVKTINIASFNGGSKDLEKKIISKTLKILEKYDLMKTT